LRWPSVLASGAFLLTLLFTACPVHADVTWTLGADGNWDVAANWSSNPNLPGSTDDVQNNTTFTITHSTGDDTINSFLSDGAFILSGGTLSGATSASTIQVNNTFTMDGGTLSNFMLKQGTGGQGITFANSANNILSNVQLFGVLNLSNGGWAHLVNGTTFGASPTVTLDNDALLSLDGTYQFGGTITAGNSNYNYVEVEGSNSLTLSSSALVTTQDTRGSAGYYTVLGGQHYTSGNNSIVNNGTIEALTHGELYIEPYSFTNNGLVQASGSNAFVALNGGSVTLGPGTTFSTDTGGAIYLETTLNNANSTFDPTVNVGGTHNFLIYNGRILDGAVTHSEQLEFVYNANNLLDGVSLDGGLNLSNGGWAHLVNGTTFGASPTVTLDNDALLSLDGTYQFGGTITAGNSNYNYVEVEGSNSLTLSSSALVTTQDTRGSAGYYTVLGGQHYTSGNNSIVNNGTIEALTHGEWVIQPGTFTNDGTLNAAGGTLVLNGGTVYLGSNSQVMVSNGGVVYLETTLDNTVQNLDAAQNPFTLLNGRILNGSVTNSESLLFASNANNKLDNVALSGGLNLSNGGWAHILPGTTFGSDSTTTLDNGAQLFIDNYNVPKKLDRGLSYVAVS
jgi:hypothetical protein